MRANSPNPKAPEENSVTLTAQVISTARRQPLLARLLVVSAGFGSVPARRSETEFEELQILYCTKGAATLVAGKKFEIVRAGDVFLHWVSRQGISSPPTSEGGATWYVSAIGSDVVEYARALGLLQASLKVPHGDDPRFIRLFGEILAALRRGAGVADLLCASSAFGYLLSLLAAQKGGAPSPTTISDKIAAAIVYMDEHLHESLKIAAIARSAGLSPDYFSELFRQQTGTSPRDYLHLLRIHRACELLRNTDLKLKQIAAQLGYQDQFHFSRKFKQARGTSPTEYRARA